MDVSVSQNQPLPETFPANDFVEILKVVNDEEICHVEVLRKPSR